MKTPLGSLVLSISIFSSLACERSQEATADSADEAIAIPSSRFDLGASSASVLFSLVDFAHVDVALEGGQLSLIPSPALAMALSAGDADPSRSRLTSSLTTTGPSLSSASLDASSIRLGDNAFIADFSLHGAADFASIDGVQLHAEFAPSPTGLTLSAINAVVSCASCSAEDQQSLADNLATPFAATVRALLAQDAVQAAFLRVLERYVNLTALRSCSIDLSQGIAIKSGRLSWSCATHR